MSLYTELVKKVEGFHEFSDSDISLKDLKIIAKITNTFQEEIKNDFGIFVKISPHFLLRMASSFDICQIKNILSIFKKVVLMKNSSWEYEVKEVWSGREELKDILEKFFLVFKFHGPKKVDFISSGIPGERPTNFQKGIVGKTQKEKRKILDSSDSNNSKNEKRVAKKAERKLKRLLRSGGHR